ncbi:MAG TPA: universal stress protein, partial [Ferruginibacter sp.]|nr:universal stress protein [Ferruginibacter sp.]
MNKILVPVDFSTCADNAVDFAIQSAKYLPVEITLLHAFELTGNVYTDYMGVNQEFNQTLLDKVKEDLSNLEKRIKEQEG